MMRALPGTLALLTLFATQALATEVAMTPPTADLGLRSGPAPKGAPALAAARPRVEVAFVLDTTGSMGGLIDGAKRRIW